jgi:hypothetical protein
MLWRIGADGEDKMIDDTGSADWWQQQQQIEQQQYFDELIFSDDDEATNDYFAIYPRTAQKVPPSLGFDRP